MKKLYAVAAGAVLLIAILALVYLRSDAHSERLHFERDETLITISNTPHAHLSLFKAGTTLDDATEVQKLTEDIVWLPRGNYFLKTETGGHTFFYPIPLISYRGGPDKEGTFNITIRASLTDQPHASLLDSSEFVFIPSGHLLFGDRLRTKEPHYVWLSGYFVSPFEVTNEEFRRFLNHPRGYADDGNWSAPGRRWKAANQSHATALLKPSDAEFERFGQPDQPVVQENWFEANAFCRWLTRIEGNEKWIFGLPTEAEWEKVARGPDNFDYSLGQQISDEEVELYNWKKNPSAMTTVVGIGESRSSYRPNRYGVYHMTGNVAEWTQSLYRVYNREQKYVDDDDRNHDDMNGERVLRGGSWYTASIAVLNIAYRENFKPEVQTPYLGFRVVARPIL